MKPRPARSVRRIKLSHSLTTLGILAAAVAQTLAGSAEWKAAPGSANWDTSSNWTPGTVPDNAADIATFDQSNITTINFGSTTTVDSLIFLEGADLFTINTGRRTFNIVGAGVTNGTGQTIISGAGGAFQGGGDVTFSNSASGENLTIINAGANSFLAGGGTTTFEDSSSANGTTITNNGATGSVSGAGTLNITDDATAVGATITTHGSANIAGAAGEANFSGNADLQDATITTNAGQTLLAAGGKTNFSDNATAEGANIITNGGDDLGGIGGTTTFSDSSSVIDGVVTTNGASNLLSSGGNTIFEDDASGNLSTFHTNGGTATISSGGELSFEDNATANDATINTYGASANFASGGSTTFSGSATALDSVINTYGGTVDYASGGRIVFEDDADASGATINTEGGDTELADGGVTVFEDNAIADNAVVTTNNTGRFDVSGVNASSFSVGSIAGSGNYDIGEKELIAGSNNADTEVSGVIADGGESGGSGGSFTKVGTGTTILSGDNTYTGDTNIDAGTVQLDGSLQSTVNVNADGILSGSGSTTGDINLSGTIAPGNSTGTLSAQNMTWNDGGVANFELASGSNDMISLSGDFLNGGVAQKNFVFDPANNVSKGQSFTLVSFGGVTDFLNTDFTFSTENPNQVLLGNFVVDGDSVDFTLTGAIATGKILQNSGPVNVLTFADFIVDGEVTTGGLNEDNTVNSLIFLNGSSLEVFNNLTVTSGDFNVENGSAVIKGDGTVLTPDDFNKTGNGLLNLIAKMIVNGDANIINGIFAVNGSLTANNVVIMINSILQGNGTINGNVVNNGITAPGNSIGSLTINGNFSQSNSGTLQIETAGTNSFDQLNVSGEATLDGTLEVIPIDDTKLAYGDKFNFLHAGKISGDFDSVVVPDPEHFRGRFVRNGGEGSALIAPRSYVQVAETQNQANVARALNSFIEEQDNDRETVSIALDHLREEQFPNAFDLIAPTHYESLANMTIDQSFRNNQLLAARFNAMRLGARNAHSMEMPVMSDKGSSKNVVTPHKNVVDKEIIPVYVPTKWAAWLQTSGSFARATHVTHLPNNRYDVGSVLVGLDYSWSENLSTGLYGGYQKTYSKFGAGRTHIDTLVAGAYATYQKDNFYADAIVGSGYSDYEARRNIKFGYLSRKAYGDPDGALLTGYLGLGYDWKINNLTVGPVASAQYNYVRVGSVTETGADSLNLRVSRQNVNSIRTNLGGRIAYNLKVKENITFIPEARITWQHEYENGSRTIQSSLDEGTGAGFDYITTVPGQDSANASLSLITGFGDRVKTDLTYIANFGSNDFESHTISAGVSYEF